MIETFVGGRALPGHSRAAASQTVEHPIQGRKAKTFLLETSKKAFFLTSMPFYWFFTFRYVLQWFDWKWFLFVVAGSFVLSLSMHGWGILHVGGGS